MMPNEQPQITQPGNSFVRNKKLILILSLFTLVGVGIGTGFGIYLSNKNKTDKANSVIEQLKANSESDTDKIATSTPTNLITISPTSTPKEIATSALLALGDGKYTNAGAKKGYIYVCEQNFNTGQGGAGKDGDWIQGKSWDPSKKASIQGNVNWPNAKITVTKDSTKRNFVTNDLPISHNTGVFPVASSDPAYEFDRNPNKISAQNMSFSLTLNPSVGTSPQCIRGTVGIMLTGVLLFDGLDAEGRDAPAHEVQDSCDGHPEKTGSYHYHSLSDCIEDGKANKLVGYAWDGFGIYGSKDSSGKELTTADLDECHGVTSEVEWEGKKVSMYHYVMTKDYPYSVGCFKGSNVYRENPQPQTQQGNRPPPPQQ
jgi:hypothetical protein